MTQRSELEWRLVAKDAASRKVRAVDRAFDSLRKGAKATKAALKGVLTVGLVGGAAGAGSLLYILKQTGDEMDRLGKSALRLGIGTESLAGFQLAAKLSGIEVNALEKSIQRMLQGIGDSNRGFGQAAQAFEDIGIDVRELKRLRPEEQFIAIREALDGIQDNSERISAATQIFGGRGVQALQLSVDTLKLSMEDIRKSGLAVTREEVARIEAANDAVTRLETAWMGVKSIVATQVAPEVEAVVSELREFLQDLSKDDVRNFAYWMVDNFDAVRDSIEQAAVKYEMLQLKIERAATASPAVLRLIGNQFSWGKALGLGYSQEEADALRARLESIRSDQERAVRREQELAAAQDQRRAARLERRAEREKEVTETIKERAAVAAEEARSASRSNDLIDLPVFDIRSSLEILREERERQRKEWGEFFVDAFTVARDRGVEMWEKIAEAGKSAFEKIREEGRKQHDETVRKLTEQRRFYQAIGDTIGYGVVDGIERAIDGTGEWRDALRNTLFDIRRLFLDQAMRAIIGDAIKGTGLFGLFLNPVPSAKGNVFIGGDVQPFARGGVVNGPTIFPMARGGVGLMGEAGPEAIMPLTRVRGNKLGVEAVGAGGVTNINLSISALDGASVVRVLSSPDAQRLIQATFGRMQQRRIA